MQTESLMDMSTNLHQFNSARVYHDLNSLAELKTKGKDDNPEAIREAAKQFESIFMGMLLKSMRDANAAIVDEPFFDSSQMDMYKEMHDEQLSLSLTTSHSGLGLTDILVRQLSGIDTTGSDKRFKIDSPEIKNTGDGLQPLTTNNGFSQNRATRPLEARSIETTLKPNLQAAPLELRDAFNIAAQSPVTKTETVNTEQASERGLDFTSPGSFVKSLWPYAQKAAEILNLDPKVLIAQAALETGWGQFVMRTNEGASSKNLFGIKASDSWSGGSTEVSSLEVESGVVSQKRSNFRTYQSYEESFADYANFISGKQRYQKAMETSHKPEEFIKELQFAGYATDPNYATKIDSIYKSPTLNDAIRTLVNNPF